MDGKLYLYGAGPVPARIMVVGESPSDDDARSNRVFSDKRGTYLRQSLAQTGTDSSTVYMTNVVKYVPKKGKIKAGDLSACRELLAEEIAAVNPELIIAAGAHAVKELLGKTAKLSGYRGMLIEKPDSAIKVFPIYNPGYIFRMPEHRPGWDADFNILSRVIAGKPAVAPPPANKLCYAAEELAMFRQFVLQEYTRPMFYIDCEWEGNNYMEEGAYLRTVQLGYDNGRVLTVHLYDENKELLVTRPPCTDAERERCRSLGVLMLPHMDLTLDERMAIQRQIFQELKQLLEHPKVGIGGHSVRADGTWLMHYGVNIRANTLYDTMIAEHTVDSRGPFGLEALTMKYTGFGRYDREVSEWLNNHQDQCRNGFGAVPDELLLPYGAFDVDSPREIAAGQAASLGPYLEPRGGYPSLFEADMHMSDVLYEMEGEGLLLDRPQFDRFQEMYSRALTSVEIKLQAAAAGLGMPDFNPRAVGQVRGLLFDTLDMTPIKTTKGAGNRSWAWVVHQDEETQADVDPSTDKDTLAILADVPGAHPIVSILRDFRKVSYVCSNWLVDAETASRFNTSSQGGGLLSKVWPDGRLHARFSQLKETARLGSAKPNVRVLGVLKPL